MSKIVRTDLQFYCSDEDDYRTTRVMTSDITKETEEYTNGLYVLNPKIEDQAEETRITCYEVDEEDSGTYFVIEDGEKNIYYFWLNVDSTGSDPNPDDDWIGVELQLSSDDSEEEIASSISSEIDSLDAFSSTSEDEKVLVTNSVAGETEGETQDYSTGFKVEIVTEGKDESIDSFTINNIYYGMIISDIDLEITMNSEYTMPNTRLFAHNSTK
ncbi:MAG: hypothetical protein ACOC22_02405, partial [bacterium]